MTAPARQRPRHGDTTAAPPRHSERARSTAAARAYAKRAQRTDRWLRPITDRKNGASFRVPFVLMVMSLLGVGLVTSLWLTTAAAADSVRLEQIQKNVRAQAESVELLKREVAEKMSPAQLDRKAKEMGLVPAIDPALLVQQPDGTWKVIGQPKAMRSAARPPASPPPAPPAEPPASPPVAPPAQAPAPPVDQPPAAQQPPPANPAAPGGAG